MKEVFLAENEGMETGSNAIISTSFQPQLQIPKEVEEYRVGYDDLRKKEENIYYKENEDFDDVCPICLDSFTIACRSNCGHLFCAACILQLWMYRYSIQPCKCPLCCCRIVNLELQTSHFTNEEEEEEDDDDDVRKEVKHYNGLYISPLFAPLHLFLGLIYERLEFEFVPTGGMGIQRMFDLIASLLVAALFLVGVVYRWMLKRRRSRLLAAIAIDC